MQLKLAFPGLMNRLNISLLFLNEPKLMFYAMKKYIIVIYY